MARDVIESRKKWWPAIYDNTVFETPNLDVTPFSFNFKSMSVTTYKKCEDCDGIGEEVQLYFTSHGTLSEREVECRTCLGEGKIPLCPK